MRVLEFGLSVAVLCDKGCVSYIEVFTFRSMSCYNG